MRTIQTMTLAACGVAATLGTVAAAEGWGPARSSSARYGLISEVCNSDSHAPYCLALGCRSGRLELVSAAGGGGPMEGRTTILFGDRSLQTTFVYDDKAVDELGIAAAWARVPDQVLRAVANAEEVRLTAPNAGVVAKHLFPTRGLASELPRAATECARSRGQRP